MKTKTLALSLMLSLCGYATMAQTDSIPKKDTIPSNDTTKISNGTAFIFSNVAQRDTVPKTDSVPKKDTSTAFNFTKPDISTFSFAVRDTVPATDSTGDSTKTDTSTAFKLFNADKNMLAFNFVKDTVPSDTDTRKKDTTMAFNLRQRVILPGSNYVLNNDQGGFLLKNESVAEIRKNV